MGSTKDGGERVACLATPEVPADAEPGETAVIKRPPSATRRPRPRCASLP
ncbi:MAG: hypothetical protein U0359_23775 [Byssovorax sp.]